MKTYSSAYPGSMFEDSQHDDKAIGYYKFEDVQQLAKDVLAIAFRNCDDSHQCERCDMYRKLKSIAGTP